MNGETDNMDKLEDSIAKYRKKKNSDTSKSCKKSDHKHKSIEVLLYNAERGKHNRAKICAICGKVQVLHYFETESVDTRDLTRRGRRVLVEDEVYERYKHLPIFNISKSLDDYISDIDRLVELNQSN